MRAWVAHHVSYTSENHTRRPAHVLLVEAHQAARGIRMVHTAKRCAMLTFSAGLPRT